MGMTANRGYAKAKNRLLQRVLGHPLPALGVHWVFQSMLYMDKTERTFKLTLDVLLTMVGGIILIRRLPHVLAWAVALFAAHTLNFLFNGHLWGALKHYGLVNQSYEEYSSYVNSFARRVERESAIRRAVLCGSLSRAEWSPTSDLDVRLVRYPGLLNGMRSCWFLLEERTRALVAGYPLDAYVLDSETLLEKVSIDDRSVDLSKATV